MNETSVQESLFEDPIGLRFRHGRERRHWSQEEVGRKLRIPVALIDAMEREDWARIGAAVYLRSHVGSYAQLLGLPATVVDEVLAGRQAPPLVPVTDHSGARRLFDRGLLRLAYVVITVALIGTAGMLVSHFQSRGSVVQLLPLDPPAAAEATQPASPANASMRGTTSAATARVPVEEAPTAMMASLTPGLATAPGANALVLRFTGASWLEAVDAAGNRVHRGMVPAGGELRFEPGQVARVTFGNADAVEVSQGGRTLDLAPYREAEVVRFAVSSQGQVAPAGN